MGTNLTKTPKEFMEILTRECRDLLDLLADKSTVPHDLTAEERNQIIREHFETDLSGYGISVEEYLEGLTTEDRIAVVNEVLALPEYND